MIKFLIVGLVLATNPPKYSTKGSGCVRDSERDKKKKSMGVLPVEANVLRAMVPVSKTIVNGSVKYYVAYH